MLSHIMPDGSERSIAYASKTLKKAKVNCPQLEKETLSIIFGLKKFHQYLYARKFRLVTDHKPLTTLLGPKSAIPTLAAARLKWWALLLSAHQYEIEYRPTSKLANADCFSRLPQQGGTLLEQLGDIEILNIMQIKVLPVRAKDIAKATMVDPVLSRVYQHVMNGWPNEVSEDLKPFKQ